MGGSCFLILDLCGTGKGSRQARFWLAGKEALLPVDLASFSNCHFWQFRRFWQSRTHLRPQAAGSTRDLTLYQRGHSNCERYEGPQAVGLQAFRAFQAPDAALGRTMGILAQISGNVNRHYLKITD